MRPEKTLTPFEFNTLKVAPVSASVDIRYARKRRLTDFVANLTDAHVRRLGLRGEGARKQGGQHDPE